MVKRIGRDEMFYSFPFWRDFQMCLKEEYKGRPDFIEPVLPGM